MKARHPIQPVVKVGKVARFKANPIVQCLLDAGPLDMNDLAIMTFKREDREQFAQLIGYSVSGASDLSYVSNSVIEKAYEEVDKLFPPKRLKAELAVRTAKAVTYKAISELKKR